MQFTSLYLLRPLRSYSLRPLGSYSVCQSATDVRQSVSECVRNVTLQFMTQPVGGDSLQEHYQQAVCLCVDHSHKACLSVNTSRLVCLCLSVHNTCLTRTQIVCLLTRLDLPVCLTLFISTFTRTHTHVLK